MMDWFTDWWRGWSEDDLRSVLEKIKTAQNLPAGGVTFVSNREMRAHLAFLKQQYPLLTVRS
jgi:hypothetical protein